MELKQFVAETLNQIIDGVKEAQSHAAEQSAEVNPDAYVSGKQDTRLWADDSMQSRLIEEVTFDVAVTALEETQTKSGIGVFVGPVGLGSQGQSDTSNQSVTRIKFSVPVLLPRTRRQATVRLPG